MSANRFITQWVLTACAVLVTGLFIVPGASAEGPTELHFLAAGYSNELVNLLEQELLPPFEAEHNVNVRVEPVGWNERTDRIAILTASGLPPDLIGTGYYSPYAEAAAGMFAPLDRYLAEWEFADRIPDLVWDTQKWRGSVYVVPLYFDLRAFAYDKNMFAEFGYDPETPPQSWEEFLSYVRDMTRIGPGGDNLSSRGVSLWGGAQELLGFIWEAGIEAANLEEFQSNLLTEQAMDAARFQAELIDASRPELGTTSGFLEGGLAINRVGPGNFSGLEEMIEGDFASQVGIFASRRYHDSDPVALGFINGIGIAEASEKKDLAWKLLAFLMSDDVQIQMQQVTGWMLARVDLAQDFYSEPLNLYYPLVAHLKAARIPPPRNISQGDLDTRMQQVYNREIPVEQAIMETHEQWSRLLQEWREDLGQ